MASTGGLKVGVLIAIGDGAPTEIATIDLPLRMELQADHFAGGSTAAVVIDYPHLHEALRNALRKVADQLPRFPQD